MSHRRKWKACLTIGVVCLLLAAMSGCTPPWEDDDDEDCPYKDKAQRIELREADVVTGLG